MSGTVAEETLARFMRGVRVTMDGSANVVRIEIQNRGTIPPELLPLIFDPMSGAGHRRTGSRGLGLGLYITREIVSARLILQPGRHFASNCRAVRHSAVGWAVHRRGSRMAL